MKISEIKQKFRIERIDSRARVKLFTSADVPALKTIFYDKVLDNMELVLDTEKQNLVDAYVSYLLSLENTIVFSCFDHENNFAGITQLKYIDSFNKKCEMGGTWYGEKFQGTGLNKACKKIIFAFVFQDLGFRRLQFSIDVDNLSSIKSMDKIGAKKEGLFRNNWVDSKGNSRDDLYFSITSEDWKVLSQSIYK